jgi:hypothetical protein
LYRKNKCKGNLGEKGNNKNNEINIKKMNNEIIIKE